MTRSQRRPSAFAFAKNSNTSAATPSWVLGASPLCAKLRSAAAIAGAAMSTLVTRVAPPAAHDTEKAPVYANKLSTDLPAASSRR